MSSRIISIHKFTAIFLIIVLIISYCPSSWAQESEITGTVNGITVSSGNSKKRKNVYARYNEKNSNKMVDISVPYTDDYFARDDEIFYQDIAQTSFGMTVAAFRDGFDEGATDDANIIDFFNQIDFTNIQRYGYDTEPTETSFACVIANKKINNRTVIAFIGSGSGYTTEWVSNFTIGTGEEHQGFSAAADMCEERLVNYINDNKIDGDICLWISGYSRASAVGNLLAGHLINNGLFSAVYAYFFATPNNTRNPIAYNNIFNIIGQNDPVPQVPLTSWGYGRNGRDLYTLSQEANSNYMVAAQKANTVMHDVSGISFRNNPDLDWQLHVVFEYLGTIFPTVEDFVATLQPQLISAYRNHSGQDLIVLLREALNNVDDFSLEKQVMVNAFMDYLDEVIYQYITGNEEQIFNGSWDEDVNLGCNIALEHVPATYLSWLLSTDNPSELYTGTTETNRLVIDGNFDLEVWDADGIVQEITSKNDETIYAPGGERRPEGADLIWLYQFNNDGTAVLNIPCDHNYLIKLNIQEDNAISLFSNHYSYGDMTNNLSDLILFSVEDGEVIVLQNFLAQDGIQITREDGTSVPFIKQDIPSSIDSITASESLMRSSHSVRDVLRLIIYILGAPLLLLLVILIIYLFNRKLKKYNVIITVCLGLISLIYVSGAVLITDYLPNKRMLPNLLGVIAVIFAIITVISAVHSHKKACNKAEFNSNSEATQ